MIIVFLCIYDKYICFSTTIEPPAGNGDTETQRENTSAPAETTSTHAEGHDDKTSYMYICIYTTISRVYKQHYDYCFSMYICQVYMFSIRREPANPLQEMATKGNSLMVRHQLALQDKTVCISTFVYIY